MPGSRIKLGHNQQFLVNGTALAGVRELEIATSSKTIDVTGLFGAWASTLPVCNDIEITATLYHQSELQMFIDNLRAHPKRPITVQIPSVFSGSFVVTDIATSVPLNDVVSFDVTLKAWGYV